MSKEQLIVRQDRLAFKLIKIKSANSFSARYNFALSSDEKFKTQLDDSWIFCHGCIIQYQDYDLNSVSQTLN